MSGRVSRFALGAALFAVIVAAWSHHVDRAFGHVAGGSDDRAGGAGGDIDGLYHQTSGQGGSGQGDEGEGEKAGHGELQT